MRINTSAPEGNVHCIMGIVDQMLRDTGQADRVEGVMARMRGGNYENACAVATEVSRGSITFYDGNKEEEDE